jgi:signal transduction histidine kinase
MATMMARGAVTTMGRGRPREVMPSRLPLILADLITAIQNIVGLEDDGLVVATVRHLLRSGRLTGLGTGTHRWPPAQPQEKVREEAMEQIGTGRPRRRGELGQHTRVFDETADTRRRLHPRERLEAHLQRQKAALEAENRHLQEVNHRQTEFVAHVSHELGTPLAAIIVSLELLLEGNVRPLAGRQRELLDLARREARRVADLTEDLLDLVRLGAIRAGLKRSALDLVRLIEDVGQLLHPQLEAKGQRLTLERDQRLPVVSGDAARVTQILTNLLSNAHKYTPPGGRITVRVRGGVSWVQVEVEDTGIGLSPEDQAHLFTPFFRAQHHTVQVAGGTGLGLAITRELVERHGGAITVRSVPGQGSTFSFTLPVRKRHRGAGVGDAPHRALSRRIRRDSDTAGGHDMATVMDLGEVATVATRGRGNRRRCASEPRCVS